MALNMRHLAADVAELRQSMGVLLSQSQHSSGNNALSHVMSVGGGYSECGCG